MGDREGILDFEHAANAMLNKSVSLAKSAEYEAEHAVNGATQEYEADMSEDAAKEAERLAKQAEKAAKNAAKAFEHSISTWGKELEKSWEKEF